MDQEDNAQSVPPEATSREVSEPIIPKEEPPSKVPSPKPHPLSISFRPGDLDTPDDETMKGLESETLTTEGLADIDMSQLGPDGTAFEETQDLTQIQSADALLGWEIMDSSINDAFTLPQI